MIRSHHPWAGLAQEDFLQTKPQNPAFLMKPIRRASFLAPTLTAIFFAQTPVHAAGIWDGTIGNYDVATNWDNDVVPTAINTNVSNGGTIQVTTNHTTLDILAGTAAGTTGTWTQSAGNLTMTGGWLRLGLAAGATGNLNLSGGTLTTVGRQDIGEITGSFGNVAVTGGTWINNGGEMAVGGNSVATAGGTGTLTLADGGTINCNQEMWVGAGPASVGTFTMTGGTVNGTSWVAIGRTGGNGTVNMSGGTWTKTGAGTNFIVGASQGAYNDDNNTATPDVTLTGRGTLNQTGGLIDVQTGVTWIAEQTNTEGTYTISGGELRTTEVVIGVNGGGNATMNFNGGTVRTGRIYGGTGTQTVSFNGTQIVSTASQAAFISNLSAASVGVGGLKIDSNGFDVSVPLKLTGPGGLVKSGAGTLMLLSDLNDYAGTNTVNGGTLGFTATDTTTTGDTTVAAGAGLRIKLLYVDDQVRMNNLTFAGATTITVDLGNTAFPTIAPLVTTNLTTNGDLTVNVITSSPVVGSYPLIGVTNKTGTGTIKVGTLPTGVEGKVTIDASGGATLVITKVTVPVWSGAITGAWDTTTLNWVDKVTLQPITFQNGLSATFNDTFTGTAAVTLNQTVLPESVLFNHSSAPYSLTGTGKISGTAGLTKAGTEALTLGTANDYTGVTSLNGGITNVASLVNGGAASPIGAATSAPANLVFGGGTLNYTGSAFTWDRGFTLAAPGGGITHNADLTLSGSIVSSGGNFIKGGTGILTLTNTGNLQLGNGGGPALNIQSGTLVLQGGGTQVAAVVGEMWLASTPDVPANLTLIGTRLTTTNFLAIGRGNGTTGVVCTMTASNSRLETANFSSGFGAGIAGNNSVQNITLTNTTWSNNGVTYLAESGGAKSTLNLPDNSSFTGTNNVLLGRDANAEGIINLAGTAAFTKTGGYLSLGSNGKGTVNVTDNSKFTADGDFNISDVGTSDGEMNISGNGAVTASAAVFIGKGGGTNGRLNVNGGFFTSGTSLSIGRYVTLVAETNEVASRAIGVVNVNGGTINQNGAAQGIIVGEEGNGTLNINSGAVNVNGIGLLISNTRPAASLSPVATGQGVVNLNGGVLTVKQVLEPANSGTSEFNFNGGTLRAGTGAVLGNFMTGLDSVVIKAGGATIDSNALDIVIPQVITGGGGLTKVGAGQLTLSGANNYTGTTTVSSGILSMGTPSFADSSSVVVATGAVLNLAHGQEDVIAGGSLGGVAMVVGNIYNSTSNPGLITGGGSLRVAQFVSSGYKQWATANSLTAGVNDAPDFDADLDGVANVLEYILGGNPISANPSILPTAVATGANFEFSFNRTDASEPNTVLTFQWSTDLQSWNDVTVGAAGSAANGQGVVVQVDEGTPTSNPDAVKVSVPKTNSTTGKIFGRLRGRAL